LEEIMLVVSGCLLAATVVTAAGYYRQLRKAQKEYERARGSVEDIVLSFNRQIKHENERLEVVAYKVEALAGKSDIAVNRADDVGKRLVAMQTKMNVDMEGMGKMQTWLEEAEKRARDIVVSQEALATKITGLEDQAKRFSMIPEAKIEAVIPIRRDKAMAQLTETEVSVLEYLAAEGAKTAPDIKERVKLSREHTARLMKKLYEEGYLERETTKIPFRYSVKKEMEKFLKKTESQPV
jgi:DNA-binding MarR family transcriptional regulator